MINFDHLCSSMIGGRRAAHGMDPPDQLRDQQLPATGRMVGNGLPRSKQHQRCLATVYNQSCPAPQREPGRSKGQREMPSLEAIFSLRVQTGAKYPQLSVCYDCTAGFCSTSVGPTGRSSVLLQMQAPATTTTLDWTQYCTTHVNLLI